MLNAKACLGIVREEAVDVASLAVLGAARSWAISC